MGTSKQQGFTIIETVLFLGVSGLLLALLLVGANGSINGQRYGDSVQTLKAKIQDQYTQLSSVQNARDNTWSCDSNAVATQGGAGQEYRGQGNCVWIGKYMTIDNDTIRIYSVLAYPKNASLDGNTNGGLDDITSLRQNYTLSASTTDVETDTMDWGTMLAWPAGGAGARTPTTPRKLGMLFVRSPDSGTVYTFTSDNIPLDPNSVGQNTFDDIIVAGTTTSEGSATPQKGQSARVLCVKSNGLVKSGDMAVYISPYATSVGSIELRSNDFMLKQTGATQC